MSMILEPGENSELEKEEKHLWNLLAISTKWLKNIVD